MIMNGMGWVETFEHEIEFVFPDAPHPSGPMPELYTAFDERGMYDRSKCVDYGHIMEFGPEKDRMLLESVEHITSLLLDDPIGFDGIGGMCDGSLMAGMVASRLSSNPASPIKFYINMCATPWHIFPEALLHPGLIHVPSVHFLGSHDQVVLDLALGDGHDPRYSVPTKCVNSHVIVFEGGHVVPSCSAAHEGALRDILKDVHKVIASSGDAGSGGSVVIDIPVDGKGAASAGKGDDAEAGAPMKDSLSRVLATGSSDAHALPTDTMCDYLYFLAMYYIIYGHLMSCVWLGNDFSCTGGNGGVGTVDSCDRTYNRCPLCALGHFIPSLLAPILGIDPNMAGRESREGSRD
jgi:hypothetical protein